MRKSPLLNKPIHLFYFVMFILTGFSFVSAQDIPLEIGNRWYYSAEQKRWDGNTGNWIITNGTVTKEITDTTKDSYRHVKVTRTYPDSKIYSDEYWLIKYGKFWTSASATPFTENSTGINVWPKILYVEGLAVDSNIYIPYVSFSCHPYKVTLWGKQYSAQAVEHGELVSHANYIYKEKTAEKLGVISDSLIYGSLSGESSEILTLTGFYANGSVIGDTTFHINSLEGDKPLRLDYTLSQNYPNPFNPSTTIRYSISEGQNVTLTVYNILGEEIITIVNEYKSAGEYNVQFNANSLPTGIYVYTIQAGQFRDSKKLLLLK